MRNKWRWLLLAITGIFFLMFGPPLVSQARDVIEATGNDANSAIIKDSNGTIISHDAQLPADQDYTVNYNWRIPNNVKITAGDTMTFQIPENVQITTDRSFPMNGFIGGTIGTFNLAAGSHTGIVTFNQAYQIATMNRSGYVRLTVKGTVPSQPSNTTPIALEKSAAWVDASDPRRINWTVHVLANNNTLVNPTFTDTLSNNHEYVANSASLKEQDGTVIPVTTTATGQQVTFAANGRYLKDLILTYQTKTNQPDGKDTFENSVNYQDSNDNSGHAEASIDRLEPDVPEEPNVAEPQEPGDEDNPGTEEPGTEEPGTEEPGTEEPGTEEPELKNLGLKNPELKNPEPKNLELNNLELKNLELKNPELKNLELSSPEPKNLELKNLELKTLMSKNLKFPNRRIQGLKILSNLRSINPTLHHHSLLPDSIPQAGPTKIR